MGEALQQGVPARGVQPLQTAQPQERLLFEQRWLPSWPTIWLNKKRNIHLEMSSEMSLIHRHSRLSWEYEKGLPLARETNGSISEVGAAAGSSRVGWS